MNDFPLVLELSILLLLTLAALYVGYLGFVFLWYARGTRGTAYYGKTLAQRRRFKETFHRYSAPARPVCHLIGASLTNVFQFRYQGVHFPMLRCSRATVRRAAQYQPQANDLFIASQMKCGTTWLQQLAYEVLSRGQGDLSDDGHVHLYALSPWLESFNSVALEEAPLIGAKETRIIKTHFPASLCPFSPQAKYLYITRHPVSCFASTVDFTQALLGPLAPSTEALLRRFCSDRMWFGNWPEHVQGYWEWAQTQSNVLFLHFEEMKQDVAGIVRQVADFLDCRLTEEEVSLVVQKCSFDYMKDHEESFEMSPPTLFSYRQTFFMSGSSQRHTQVNPSQSEQILDFCQAYLRDSTYPISRYVPEIRGSSPD